MNDAQSGDMHRVAIITGASGHLGKAVCRLFLSTGYTVHAVAGSRKPECDPEFKDRFFAYQTDLSSEAAAEILFDGSFSGLDYIHAGIFLAGGFAPGGIGTVRSDDIQAMYRINFASAFFLSQHLFTKMAGQKNGKLCFIGARPAVEPGTGADSAAYTLSKAMVVRLAEMYGEAGRKSGIGSAAFIPSVIDTSDNRKAMPEADFTRWVSPSSIAEALLFFCSDAASAIRTGVFKLYGNS
jgi:NAD(P)-dependent dehydrogenase (short-subunit alcohol dehydrogenase family)